jgi:iron(III) transport system ATP-binding protein
LDQPSTARPIASHEDTGETPSFIRVRNLTKRFDTFVALNNVSISEKKGGTLALLGPSGCGKTTMLRCIGGLETPTEGIIEIGGQVVFDSKRGIDLKPEKRALGIVFQSYAIWPHMSVSANVGFPLRVRGVSRKEMDERIDHILGIVGLAAWRDRPATELSGGQQQRVALARALIHEPSLVLFDEPMSNLDAQLRDQMRLELKMLQERLNFTAIYVTHDQSEAFALAKTVVVMNRGQIETIGAPREVAHRPKTPFVARFFGYNTIKGIINAPDAAGNSARITLGPSFKVSGVAGPGLAADQPGVLCVRREHVAVEKQGTAPPIADPNGRRQVFSGIVRAIAFQGLQQEYMLDVGGASLRAIGASLNIEVDEVVNVVLDRDDCVILPVPKESDTNQQEVQNDR